MIFPDVLSGRPCLQRQGLVGECGLVYVQWAPYDVALPLQRNPLRAAARSALPTPRSRPALTVADVEFLKRRISVHRNAVQVGQDFEIG